MKVKTHFKQMFLVDNVVYNKINNAPSSQVHHTTLQIPSTLNVPSAPPNSSSLFPPSASSAPSTDPAPSSKNKTIKKNLTNHMTSDNNSNQQEIANMKPFEVEGNQWLDETIRDYNSYNDMVVDKNDSNVTQPPLQSANPSEQMRHATQLPSIQPTPAMTFEQPQALQYQDPPTTTPISMESPRPPVTFDQPQALEYAHPKPPTLKPPISMEYQQSPIPAMTFNQPPTLQNHHPSTTTPISLEYQQSPMPAMAFDQPLALNYHHQPTALEYKKPMSMEYHQSPIPAIEMNQCHECDDTTLSQKALPPPKNAQAPQQSLPAPTTYPNLSGPQSTALVLPNQEANSFPLASSSTLPPPPTPAPPVESPTLPEPPTQPTPKNVAKYHGYISTKPSSSPDMITYICTRCNTHFKKESSLLRHNKRFHPEFEQTVKGKKRESIEEITHGVRKKPKLNGQKRKRIRNSTPNKRFLPYVKST